MITHDKAKELFKHMIYSARRGLVSHGVLGQSAIKDKQTGEVSICSLEDMCQFEEYIKDQEHKDKVSLIEKELLQLYRNKHYTPIYYDGTQEKINELEKKLKDGVLK